MKAPNQKMKDGQPGRIFKPKTPHLLVHSLIDLEPSLKLPSGAFDIAQDAYVSHFDTTLTK
jgi:hypothetical protein